MIRTMPVLHPDDIRRLWANIIRRTEDECWPWVLSTDEKGYGRIGIKGKFYKTHRLVYFITYGQDPGELHVLHECDYRACHNPGHLFLGTHQDNMTDLKIKRRRNMLDIDIAEVFSLLDTMTQDEVAKYFGCSQCLISNIVNGKSYHRQFN